MGSGGVCPWVEGLAGGPFLLPRGLRADGAQSQLSCSAAVFPLGIWGTGSCSFNLHPAAVGEQRELNTSAGMHQQCDFFNTVTLVGVPCKTSPRHVGRY